MEIKKKFRTESVNKMAFFNILGPVVLNGINFFTIPIFTRILGTGNYGLYTIYVTWLNVVTIIISMQVQGTIGIANVRLEQDKKNGYYSSVLSISCLCFAIIMLLAVVFRDAVSQFFGLPQMIVVVLILNALGMAFVNIATTRFTYEKEAQKTFATSVGVAILGVVLSLMLFRVIEQKEQLYMGRVFGMAVSYVLIGFCLAFFIFKRGKTVYSKEYWKFCLPLCIPLIFHSLSHVILGQADKVMVQKMMGDDTVGIFGFIVSFAQLMNVIYNSFNTTWVPFYFDDIKSNNIESINKRTKNYLFIFTGLSLGFILLAPEVVKIFATKEFWSGNSVIPMLVLGHYMVFLYSFPVNFEFYHKKTIHIAVGTAVTACINIFLNYFMIKERGMAGAAEATCLAYALLWLFHHIVAKYIIGEKYHYKLKTFLPSLGVMIVGCLAVGQLQEQILIRWGIAVVVGIIMLRHVWKEKTLF